LPFSDSPFCVIFHDMTYQFIWKIFVSDVLFPFSTWQLVCVYSCKQSWNSSPLGLFRWFQPYSQTKDVNMR
jgi:hypothetical protein